MYLPFQGATLVPVHAAAGQVLTAAPADSHNEFDHPHTVEPRPFAGQAGGRRLGFDLPPKSIAAVEVR